MCNHYQTQTFEVCLAEEKQSYIDIHIALLSVCRLVALGGKNPDI